MAFSEIAEMIKGPLEMVEKDIYSSINSSIPMVNELISSVIKSGGKRIRPVVAILAAGACGYSGKDIYKIGTILEYIHTSSLLHDDVIDEAATRRGEPSANSKYGNKIAILAGDYLYTTAFLKSLELPPADGHARLITKAVASMSEGEILQMNKMGDLSLTFEEYSMIIYCKTVALFASACECAAILGKQSKKNQQAMYDFGCNVGYAFQLKDDILDYFGDLATTGKNIGTDLEEKKVTLPIKLLINEVGKEKVAKIFLSDLSINDRLNQLQPLFKEYNIYDKSISIVTTFVDKAVENLSSFPDSNYKKALFALTQELIIRKN